jgi:sec-independent protein translocase protein TatB
VFGNLNWLHIVILLLLALFIFGDKLPHAIGEGLRMLRNLRRMAQTATSDLSRELGTDIQLEDLHPKTFVRKHLLSEADQDALLKPFKEVSEDVMKQARGVESDIKDVGRRADGVAGDVKAATSRRRTNGRGAGRGAAKPAESPAAPAESPVASEAPPPPVAPAPRPSYDDIT